MEIVTYDPENPDTYPSVCNFEEEVANRFGYVGGEKLLFDDHGSFIGRIVDELPTDSDREWRIVNGVRFCEDYPACGHEMGDCDGSKYGTDQQIKERHLERMRMEDEGYFYPDEE